MTVELINPDEPVVAANVTYEKAIQELLDAGREGARNIAIYGPKNRLLSAILTVELLRKEN